MKKYYIRDFDNKENYLKFIHYLMSNSDTFSLVYLRYQENSKPTKTTKQVSKMLAPYKIYAERVFEWPSMITWDTVHIYKLAMYRACEEAEEVLALADNYRLIFILQSENAVYLPMSEFISQFDAFGTFLNTSAEFLFVFGSLRFCCIPLQLFGQVDVFNRQQSKRNIVVKRFGANHFLTFKQFVM